MNDMALGQEAISALADGQLRGDEFVRAVESATSDVDALATWHVYHVVGDVLRYGEQTACHQNVDFMLRLKTRLRQEQIQVPAKNAMNSEAESAYSSMAKTRNDASNQAANDSIFRWKLVAGFASFAAVAAISWNALSGANLVTSQPQLALAVIPMSPQATQGAVDVADNTAPVLIRDPRLDAFLAAHEQFGGTSALQMPAGFFRNATFEAPTR